MRASDTKRAKQVNRALARLDLPPAERKRWCQHFKFLDKIAEQDDASNDDFAKLSAALASKRGQMSLESYLKALRRVQACHAALDPAIQLFSPLKVLADIHWAATHLNNSKRAPRPGGRPVDQAARAAVAKARFLLEALGLPLTTGRKGMWHQVSQDFADTNHDLRHHLANSLEPKATAGGLPIKHFSLIR
jgi:hypothetical protein